MTSLRDFAKISVNRPQGQLPSRSETDRSIPNYYAHSDPTRISRDSNFRPSSGSVQMSAPNRESFYPRTSQFMPQQFNTGSYMPSTSVYTTPNRTSIQNPLARTTLLSSTSNIDKTSSIRQPAEFPSALLKETKMKKTAEFEAIQMKQLIINGLCELPLLILIYFLVNVKVFAEFVVLTWTITYIKEVRADFQSSLWYLAGLLVIICAIFTDMVEYDIYTLNSLIFFVPIGVYLIWANFPKIYYNSYTWSREQANLTRIAWKGLKETVDCFINPTFFYTLITASVFTLFVSAVTDSLQYDMFSLNFFVPIIIASFLITLVINFVNLLNMHTSLPDKPDNTPDRFYFWGLRLDNIFLKYRSLKYIHKAMASQKDIMQYPSDYKSVSSEKTNWNTYCSFAKATLNNQWRKIVGLRNEYQKYYSMKKNTDYNSGRNIITQILCEYDLFRLKHQILRDCAPLPLILEIMIEAMNYQAKEGNHGVVSQIRGLVGDSLIQLLEALTTVSESSEDEKVIGLKKEFSRIMDRLGIRSY